MSTKTRDRSKLRCIFLIFIADCKQPVCMSDFSAVFCSWALLPVFKSCSSVTESASFRKLLSLLTSGMSPDNHSSAEHACDSLLMVLLFWKNSVKLSWWPDLDFIRQQLCEEQSDTGENSCRWASSFVSAEPVHTCTGALTHSGWLELFRTESWMNSLWCLFVCWLTGWDRWHRSDLHDSFDFIRFDGLRDSLNTFAGELMWTVTIFNSHQQLQLQASKCQT